MNALFILMGAQGANGQAGGSMTMTFITIGLMILVFYFLLIRPQKKKDREAKEMLAAMKKGDKVITIGGLHGKVTKVSETTVVIKVKDGSELEFTKSAISTVLNKTEPKGKKDKSPKNDKEVETVAEVVPVETEDTNEEESSEDKNN